MISVGFKRVSKKRPCRICGKPTYCGFSRDEGTSICMRIRVLVQRLNASKEHQPSTTGLTAVTVN